MNILLIVIDSLRARSLLPAGSGAAASAPFFADLDRSSVSFRRAYAAECWTLPSHVSMFTGLLPSEHGAHFQTMGYSGEAPTLAELLSEAGFHTEVVSRNFMFDATMPGVTRGFQQNTQPLARLRALHPFALILTLTKPRNRRLMKSTGFFHPRHRESRQFLARYSRALLPADELVLTHLIEQMQRLRSRRKPYFLFANLYDVHWPYPPSEHSVLERWSSCQGWWQNLRFPLVLPAIGSHGYLREGFRLSESSRRMLLGRYHRAVALMGRKLGRFYAGALGLGLFEDTLLVITSDHGEAFGEHGLYLHDGSLYDVHLHVPLWVRHPECSPQTVEDVVSTRDLFGLMRAAALNQGLKGTILDAGYRAAHPIALAEHFYYPRVPDMLPRYRQNIAGAVSRSYKIIVRREGVEGYAAAADAEEIMPHRTTVGGFEAECCSAGLPADAASSAARHLRAWSAEHS
jgi:arylsulfatase A-like enzyme